MSKTLLKVKANGELSGRQIAPQLHASLGSPRKATKPCFHSFPEGKGRGGPSSSPTTEYSTGQGKRQRRLYSWTLLVGIL